MEIKLFNFQDKEVRTTLQGRDVWFAAIDVFRVIKITWKGGNNLRVDKKIPPNWITSRLLESSGGLQETLFINEQALYKLLFQAKPKDKDVSRDIDTFCNWVAELLVKIRKGSQVPFAGKTQNDHMRIDVQKQNSKAINSKMFMDGDINAIKDHNTKNCQVHTGKKPAEVKAIGKSLGLKSKDRSSAKEVLRHVKPELAASMSLTDVLVGEDGMETEKAAKICREFAVPLYQQLIAAGAYKTLNLSE